MNEYDARREALADFRERNKAMFMHPDRLRELTGYLEAGFDNGVEAYKDADLQPGEDARETAMEAENVGRQYGGHIIYEINSRNLDDEHKFEEAVDAYETGVFAGIEWAHGWFRRAASSPNDPSVAKTSLTIKRVSNPRNY